MTTSATTGPGFSDYDVDYDVSPTGTCEFTLGDICNGEGSAGTVNRVGLPCARVRLAAAGASVGVSAKVWGLVGVSVSVGGGCGREVSVGGPGQCCDGTVVLLAAQFALALRPVGALDVSLLTGDNPSRGLTRTEADFTDFSVTAGLDIGLPRWAAFLLAAAGFVEPDFALPSGKPYEKRILDDVVCGAVRLLALLL